MRIRSIKPEFWRSQDISDLTMEDRLLFIGLWSYVDDNGVGRYDTAIIAADLFAHDLSREPIETLSRVSTGSKRLSEKGLVTLYSVDGRDYIAINTWEKHQRVNNPNKPRYPRPEAVSETLSRVYIEPIETLPPGAGEQGSRGTGEQGNRIMAEKSANEFQEFYDTYPRKMKRGDAEKAYKKALQRADAFTILAGAKRLADDPNLPETIYIPYPASWLRADGWLDDPLPPRRGSQQQTSSTTDERVAGWLALGEQMTQPTEELDWKELTA